MRRKKIRTAIACLTCIGMLGSAAGIVQAAWQSNGETGNIISTGVCRNEIIEEYTEPEPVIPGETITKKVNVSNTGTIDTFIRIKLEPQFGQRKADDTFIVDQTLSKEMIQLNCNTTHWVFQEGYHYYKEPLKVGETTKEPLLESFSLNEKAGNEYKGKDARILVYLETVQAQGDAAAIWNISKTKLDLKMNKEQTSEDTYVTYQGKEKGFAVSLEETDLFANFKQLLPGCARNQTIHVKNDSKEEVEITLRAEQLTQKGLSADEKKALKQLMEQYAQIEIKEQGKLLYSGPVSGNLQKEKKTMKEPISLGKYAAGKTHDLQVKLSLTPDMGNHFQNLTGMVKWVFSVSGDDSVTGTVYPAKTGDETELVTYVILFFFFFVLALLNQMMGANENGGNIS